MYSAPTPSACLALTPPSTSEGRRKLVSVVLPTYNEELNVHEIYSQVAAYFKEGSKYDLEILFIDNDSQDNTVRELKKIGEADKRVKAIVNARNFGHIRSPMHGIFQASGDIVIFMASDLQDPPSLIPEFLQKWEEGYPIVLGIKKQVEENFALAWVRRFYYDLVSSLAEIRLFKNFTGFGLYDRRIIEILREMQDPYPYFRGLISEIGFPTAQIYFNKPARKRGISANNFYTLYDIAMLGITNHSKIPLRLAVMAGFCMAMGSLFIAFCYFVAKLIFWNTFSIGMAPLIIGLFFFSSVQLFFIGILGEYIGSIYTQVQKRPLVVEKERINFSQKM